MSQLHDLAVGHLERCQLCGSPELELVLDLGHHPPCDSLLTEAQLHQPERTYPLRFLRCRVCGLAQIDYVVAPEELFYADYPYRTGITETLSRNFHDGAAWLARKLALEPGALVVDIGSNDGTYLQGFRNVGMRVLGVEPTKIAEIARRNGIECVNDFFDEPVAGRIREQHGPAALITAANVFAHVARLGELLRGARALLKDDGMFVSESHYLLDILTTVQYDSIYHEHLRYYAVKPLIRLMREYEFTLVDVERIPNYGGSIRVYAKKGVGHPVAPAVDELVGLEERSGIYTGRAFAPFRDRVVRSKLELQSLLLEVRRKGSRVVGIACPGRSSTLLNYCNIDRDLMDYVAEQKECLKLGLFVPGTHLPVIDERAMFEEQPEYAVMLSWHYGGPILKKLREKGLNSRVIMPLPDVRIDEA